MKGNLFAFSAASDEDASDSKDDGPVKGRGGDVRKLQQCAEGCPQNHAAVDYRKGTADDVHVADLKEFRRFHLKYYYYRSVKSARKISH